MHPNHDETLALEDAERLRAIHAVLEYVMDPEIPTLNVVEMGMIAGVRIEPSGVVVDMTPTFAGCPALNFIQEDILNTVTGAGEPHVTVNVVYDPPWTTDRLTDGARRKLKEFGLAPPGKRCAGGQPPDIAAVPCPYCDSAQTDLESIFGPTLCRSIHYCRDCQQSFEHFKAV
jgi:ring-1,2-phenylacetyl-CoA epoxidase subunit PaaD